MSRNPISSSQPVSDEQLIRTRIAVLHRDRERRIERHKQALAGIDHLIEKLEKALTEYDQPQQDANGFEL